MRREFRGSECQSYGICDPHLCIGIIYYAYLFFTSAVIMKWVSSTMFVFGRFRCEKLRPEPSGFVRVEKESVVGGITALVSRVCLLLVGWIETVYDAGISSTTHWASCGRASNNSPGGHEMPSQSVFVHLPSLCQKLKKKKYSSSHINSIHQASSTQKLMVWGDMRKISFDADVAMNPRAHKIIAHKIKDWLLPHVFCPLLPHFNRWPPSSSSSPS